MISIRFIDLNILIICAVASNGTRVDLFHVKLSLLVSGSWSDSPYSSGTARISVYASSSNAQTSDFQVRVIYQPSENDVPTALIQAGDIAYIPPSYG